MSRQECQKAGKTYLKHRASSTYKNIRTWIWLSIFEMHQIFIKKTWKKFLTVTRNWNVKDWSLFVMLVQHLYFLSNHLRYKIKIRHFFQVPRRYSSLWTKKLIKKSLDRSKKLICGSSESCRNVSAEIRKIHQIVDKILSFEQKK